MSKPIFPLTENGWTLVWSERLYGLNDTALGAWQRLTKNPYPSLSESDFWGIDDSERTPGQPVKLQWRSKGDWCMTLRFDIGFEIWHKL